jgi:hypothetical protein
VFALVDRASCNWSGQPLGWSRQGVYSAAFFLSVAVAAAACALTAVLRLDAAELNGPLVD